MTLVNRPIPDLSHVSLPVGIVRDIAEIKGGWAIHPDVAAFLGRLVIDRQFRHIIEFGGGSSTRIFVGALQSIGGGCLTSVEENPKWCEAAWQEAKAVLGEDARLLESRTRLRLDRHGAYFGYDLQDKLEGDVRFDLAFVDAPQGALGRSGGVHAIIDRLMPGALVIFDDTARDKDKRTIERLLVQHPQLVLEAHDESIGRGLTILRNSRFGSSKGRFVLGAALGGCVDLLRSARQIRAVRRKTVEDFTG